MIDYSACPKCDEKVAYETTCKFGNESVLFEVEGSCMTCGYQLEGSLEVPADE